MLSTQQFEALIRTILEKARGTRRYYSVQSRIDATHDGSGWDGTPFIADAPPSLRRAVDSVYDNGTLCIQAIWEWQRALKWGDMR